MARESSRALGVQARICVSAILFLLALTITGCGSGSQSSSNPSGTQKQQAVTLTWTASTSSVAGYNVYRGSASGGPYTRVNPVLEASTHYVDNSIAGGTYFYAVTAQDASGVESYFSNEESVTTPSP